MIFNVIIKFIFLILQGIFYLLPVVTISSIPYIGTFISDSLTTMTQIWNSFIDTLPYAEIVWQVFLYVIIPFEILLLIGKFFLGHRLPTQTH